LRNHLFRLSLLPELQNELLQIIHHKHFTNEHVFFKLKGAGLVKRIGSTILPRNSLYAHYFKEHLDG
jgi:hypothetical protein